MATIQSDLMDDPVVSGSDAAFLAGQFSAQRESSIVPGGFARGVNVDFDSFGRPVTRRGAKSLVGNTASLNWESETATWNGSTKVWGAPLTAGTTIDGAAFFPGGTTSYVLVAQGGNLKQGLENAAFANISGATYTGSFVYFAQLGSRMYYCDENGALRYVDSSVANQAITAGRISSIKITEPGVGYNAAPAITFTHNGGASGAATAVLGYGGRVVSATITNVGSGYSATTPPTIAFAAAPAGGTTALGVVNMTQVPSKPKFLVAHTNRLFCASADTAIPADTLYVSDFLDGDSWDLAGNSLRIGGDNDPITAIYPWINNNLVVFKRRSIHMVIADPLVDPAEWEIRLLSNRIGCVSHRSVQAVGADIYFLAQDGVRAMSQIESGSVADIGQPLSFPVQDVIDGLTRANQPWICSAFYKNLYFLSVTTGEGATPTISGVVVRNELRGSWLGQWTNWQPREFFISAFSGRLRLNFADHQGRLWTWDDFSTETVATYLDDSSAYESSLTTRAYDCGEPLVDKTGHVVQFWTENRLTDSAVTCYASYDKDMSGSFTSLDSAIVVDAGDKQKRRSFNLLSKGKWNAMQFKFGAMSGKMTLAGVAVTAFPDNIKPEIS